jgi:hypothetical protein
MTGDLYAVWVYINPYWGNDDGYVKLKWVVRLTPEELIALNALMQSVQAHLSAKHKEYVKKWKEENKRREFGKGERMRMFPRETCVDYQIDRLEQTVVNSETLNKELLDMFERELDYKEN